MVKKLPEPTKIILRKEALEKGLPHFFTGKPCKYGHISFRRIYRGRCVQCERDLAKKIRPSKIQKVRESGRVNHIDKLPIISREEAIKKGLLKYFDGVSICSNYHIAERYVKKSRCVKCQIEHHQKNFTSTGRPHGRSHWSDELDKIRQEARDKGNKRYFTGRPCRNGHISERWLKTNICVQCSREKNKWRWNNIESVREHHKEYRKSRSDIDSKLRMKRYHSNEKHNPEAVLIRRLRGRIREVFRERGGKYTTKAESSMKLVGCTRGELREHIEKQFKDGMGFHNKDKWHIDHIVPVEYFTKHYDWSSLTTQRIAFHYSNLQPLWAEENIAKKDNISKKEAEKKIREIRNLIRV